MTRKTSFVRRSEPKILNAEEWYRSGVLAHATRDPRTRGPQHGTIVRAHIQPRLDAWLYRRRATRKPDRQRIRRRCAEPTLWFRPAGCPGAVAHYGVVVP